MDNAHIVVGGRVYCTVPLHVLEAIAHADQLEVEFPPPGERGWATAERSRDNGLAAWVEVA